MFKYTEPQKRLITLALAGLVWIGGNAMAMNVDVDSATKDMPGKVESTVLSVPVKTPMINQISDVVYEQVPMRGYPNVAMKMDILQPKSDTKQPAIVYVTGGGFINANKDNGIQLRMRLAEAGYVVASIQYRVAPTARFPEPLEDVKASIRYLKAHADQFGIDPEQIGIIGGSAGGYLTAMAATTSGTTTFDKGDNLQVGSDVKAAVDLYGLSDLTRIGDDYSESVKKAHQSPLGERLCRIRRPGRRHPGQSGRRQKGQPHHLHFQNQCAYAAHARHEGHRRLPAPDGPALPGPPET